MKPYNSLEQIFLDQIQLFPPRQIQNLFSHINPEDINLSALILTLVIRSMQAQQPQIATAEQPAAQQQQNKIQLVPGQLWKIIHQEGQGPTPTKGQQIFALYRGTLENGSEFDSNQDRDSPFKFNLGQGRVIKGWDEGFASMKKGERATLICAPQYAYGKRGSPPRIPPNSTLHFEVELLDFQHKQKEKWQLSEQQKLAEATKAKNQGNQAFKKGEYKQATKLYNKGIGFVEDEEGTECVQVLNVLRLNTAQSQIKIGEYSEAIKNCTKVLEKDNTNLKALYRRGLSHLKSQDFEKAQTDFETLLKVDPSNVEAQKQLQNVKVSQRAFRQKQKKVFGNMFSKPLNDETKKQQTPIVSSEKQPETEQTSQQEPQPEKNEQEKKND